MGIPIVIPMTDSNNYLNPVALPIGEVARLLGVSIGTVRNWERSGKIAAFRTPGGQRRFTLAEVQSLLQTTPSSDEAVTPLAAEGRTATPLAAARPGEGVLSVSA